MSGPEPHKVFVLKLLIPPCTRIYLSIKMGPWKNTKLRMSPEKIILSSFSYYLSTKYCHLITKRIYNVPGGSEVSFLSFETVYLYAKMTWGCVCVHVLT